jgi:hypothetical protein
VVSRRVSESAISPASGRHRYAIRRLTRVSRGGGSGLERMAPICSIRSTAAVNHGFDVSRIHATPHVECGLLVTRAAAILRTETPWKHGFGTWRSLASALAWGARGRGFKSRRPDLMRPRALRQVCRRAFLLWGRALRHRGAVQTDDFQNSTLGVVVGCNPPLAERLRKVMSCFASFTNSSSPRSSALICRSVRASRFSSLSW